MACTEDIVGLVRSLSEFYELQSRGWPTKRGTQRLQKIIYNILIFKNTKPENDITAIECQLLTHKYHAKLSYDSTLEEKIKLCYNRISAPPGDKQFLNNVLHFMLQLKILAATEATTQISSKKRVYHQYKMEEFRFHVENPIQLHPIQVMSRPLCIEDYSRKPRRHGRHRMKFEWESTDSESEGDLSDYSEEGIVSVCPHRIWQTLGTPLPRKELPFMMESEPDTFCELFSMWHRESTFYMDDEVFEPGLHIVSLTSFISELKDMLVGIESRTFGYVLKKFRMDCAALYEGLSQTTLVEYIGLLLQCGTIYKQLKDMIHKVKVGKGRGQVGFLFREFCGALERYLVYYRMCVYNCPQGNNALGVVYKQMLGISDHLFLIASLCKVGPFRNKHSKKIPTGYQLLNFLYRSTMTQTNTEILRVLYGLLYPCLQSYFARFLQPWLMEGEVYDPYDEFFIEVSETYAKKYNCNYWHRTFTLILSMVPDFLYKFKEKIFYCGRMRNMLKKCAPNSAVCTHYDSCKPILFYCCITQDQVRKHDRAVRSYQVDVMTRSGSTFSVSEYLAAQKYERLVYQRMVIARRVPTIRRIQAKKIEIARRKAQEKKVRVEAVRAEYLKAIKEKKRLQILELEKQLNVEKQLQIIRDREEKLLIDEAESVVARYEALMQKANKLKKTLDSHKKTVWSIHLETESTQHKPWQINNLCADVLNANCSSKLDLNETNVATNQQEQEINSNIINIIHPEEEINSNHISIVHQDDEIKGIISNNINTTQQHDKINSNITARETSVNYISYERNLRHIHFAREKYLSQELGLENISLKLTAKPNNLRRLSSESDVIKGSVVAEPRRTRSCHSNDPILWVAKKEHHAQTAFQIDWYYVWNIFNTSHEDASRIKALDFQIQHVEDRQSHLTNEAPKEINDEAKQNPLPPLIHTGDNFARDLTMNQIMNERMEYLPYFISLSYEVPLKVQYSLVAQDLLRHFFVDLKCLERIDGMRSCFFMFDGSFKQVITESIFGKLYSMTDPRGLLHVPTLQCILDRALRSMLKPMLGAESVSFRLRQGRARSYISHYDILDCMTLSYKASWPMNVLLSQDNLRRYGGIFQFLLKISRAEWVLHRAFMDLKYLRKECGARYPFLLMSSQNRKIQIIRHIMTHFVQAFQSYILSTMQFCWEVFMKRVSSRNFNMLDHLVYAHERYVKRVHFLCMLNPKTKSVLKVMTSLFTVVMKFYDYLRSRRWEYVDDEYIHPNFAKLVHIFNNFMEIAQYFVRIGRVMAGAYKFREPRFTQLLDKLDLYRFYNCDIDKLQTY